MRPEQDIFRQNPFWLLGVSLDDDLDFIDEQAEELEFEEPEVDWKGAAKRLRSPQERIRSEVAWLPGLDGQQAEQAARSAMKGEHADAPSDGALAVVNLRIVRLMASRKGRDDLTEQLMGIAEAWEHVHVSDVARQINAHRQNAGIRAKVREEKIGMALEEHRAKMASLTWAEVERLPSWKLVDAILDLSQVATNNGRKMAPKEVREWVSAYDRRYAKFFAENKDSMATLTRSVMAALKREDAGRAAKITRQYCEALKTWDRIAQPIQLVHQGNGTTDAETERVFEASREFSLCLNNEHGETELAAQVVETQRRVFKEAEKLDEHLIRDEYALADLLKEKRGAQERLNRTPKIKPYVTQIGLIKRTPVEIANERIRVGNQAIHPDKVTGLRWGGIQMNLGSSYYEFAVRSAQKVLEMTLKKADVFEHVVEALWAGCGARIATKIAVHLSEGGTHDIGRMSIRDEHVLLTRKRWLKEDETHWVRWADTTSWAAEGKMIVQHKGDSKKTADFSLRYDWNGVLIAMMMSARERDKRRLLSQ